MVVMLVVVVVGVMLLLAVVLPFNRSSIMRSSLAIQELVDNAFRLVWGLLETWFGRFARDERALPSIRV